MSGQKSIAWKGRTAMTQAGHCWATVLGSSGGKIIPGDASIVKTTQDDNTVRLELFTVRTRTRKTPHVVLR